MSISYEGASFERFGLERPFTPKGAFTPDANDANKSRVVGGLNILSSLASFAREIRNTTDVNLRHGGGFCRQLQSSC